MKVISRNQLMKNLRREMPKPSKVMDKVKHSRKQKHSTDYFQESLIEYDEYDELATGIADC